MSSFWSRALTFHVTHLNNAVDRLTVPLSLSRCRTRRMIVTAELLISCDVILMMSLVLFAQSRSHWTNRIALLYCDVINRSKLLETFFIKTFFQSQFRKSNQNTDFRYQIGTLNSEWSLLCKCYLSIKILHLEVQILNFQSKG